MRFIRNHHQYDGGLRRRGVKYVGGFYFVRSGRFMAFRDLDKKKKPFSLCSG